MLDIKVIREDPDLVKRSLANRGIKGIDIDGLLSLDEERRKLVTDVEVIKAEKNRLSKEIGEQLKNKNLSDDLKSRSKGMSQKIGDIETKVGELDNKVADIMAIIPNIPHDSIPIGSPEANKVVKEWGGKAQYEFKPREHTELIDFLGIVDLTRAAKITGSNFLLFKGLGARLERALISFMLDLHTKEHGYTEIFPPFLVNGASMFGTGQLPKLAEDMYKLSADDLYLIPTAEVPVTNIHRDEILTEDQLPIYYTAYSACFRREAGSYGKDTKGMTRVHQFDKVELVKFVKPETSFDELEKLLANAEKVLQLLGLPYRVLMLATGDISFAAAKCYDIEVWAPGLDRYLEVSSCSNFVDFQARRANIRFRRSGSKKVEFVHTLNGSGVALARLVIALIETYQQKDRTVAVPEPLRPYLGGLSVLQPR